MSPEPVEVRFACRVGGRGLATVRRHPQRPELARVAVGASVRFTIAADDAEAVRDAVQRARHWGRGTVALADGTGLYLTASHSSQLPLSETVFRLSIGSPLRRWLWRSELTALAAVLGRFAAEHPPAP